MGETTLNGRGKIICSPKVTILTINCMNVIIKGINNSIFKIQVINLTSSFHGKAKFHACFHPCFQLAGLVAKHTCMHTSIHTRGLLAQLLLSIGLHLLPNEDFARKVKQTIFTSQKASIFCL